MSSDAVRQCISALSAAATDTQRFAALLLVPKLVRADCGEADRKLLFEAVGFGFVSRLLVSDTVPAGCPAHLFRSVGLSVLAAFCSVPEFQRCSVMVDQVPRFLEVLTDGGFSREERAMKNDALTCLQSLAASPESCRAIAEHDGVSKLCEVYAVDDARHNFKEQIFSVVSAVVSALGPECWGRRPSGFHVLMNALSRRLLAEERTQRKFVLCDVIRGAFAGFPDQLRDTSASEPWYAEFNEELLGILRFRLGDAQREPLLKLCATLVDKLGVPWAVSGSSGDSAKSLRMFFLLVQLSCVEVRMIAEDRSFEQVMQKSEMAAACFAVLENAIRFLIEDGGQTVDDKQRGQLTAALTAAFAAVLGFLRLVAGEPDVLMDSAGVLERQFLVAAVRVTGAWLAEETAALREDVYGVLPFLLRVAREERKCNGTGPCRRGGSNQCRGGSGQFHGDSGERSGGSGQCRGSSQCLRFLLPALCHLSVEDPARAIMLEAGIPELLAEYAAELWQTFMEEEAVSTDDGKQTESDAETALATICGILMNITVLEADRVSGHPGFSRLLLFVFSALPAVDNQVRHLVLRGNLCTLGLLLLRRFSQRARAHESAMYRYLSASVRFLWDAFDVEETSEVGRSLVVNFAYRAVWDDVREMWYLGMQALSDLLPAMPWIAEFIVESGWAQEIVGTLAKAGRKGLEGSVRTAYEDFLCCLVRCCGEAADNLKEHGAIDVCGVHKMKELGMLLRMHVSAADAKSVACE